MKVKDENGREIYISVYGQHDDDIQIDDAYYEDDDSEVSDATIEYIYEKYAQEIYEAWYDNMISRSESYYEGDR